VTRKGLISLFCVLNLSAILYANVPVGLATWTQAVVSRLGPQGQAWVGSNAWLLGRWAHLTGLGARWQLFGPLPAHDYAVTLAARWPDGTTTTLPTSPWRRTGLQSVLTEHKQQKIDLNLIWNTGVREGWGRQVCRWLAATTGRAPATVAFVVQTWPVVPRPQADATGIVHGPPEPATEIAAIDCVGAT